MENGMTTSEIDMTIFFDHILKMKSVLVSAPARSPSAKPPDQKRSNAGSVWTIRTTINTRLDHLISTPRKGFLGRLFKASKPQHREGKESK